MKKVLCFLLTVAIVMSFSVAAFAAVVSDFEDDDVTTWALQSDGNEWNIGTGYVEIDSTRAASGSKSLKVVGNQTDFEALGNYSLNLDMAVSNTVESGGVAVLNIYVDGNSNVATVQPYDQDSGWAWSGFDTVTLEEGKWNQIKVTLHEDAAYPINRVGLQIIPVDTTKEVVLWVDDLFVGPEAEIPSVDTAAAPAEDTAAAAEDTGDAGFLGFALVTALSGLAVLKKRK